MPQYSVNNLTVDNVLGYIKNKEISIPEIAYYNLWFTVNSSRLWGYKN